MRVVRSVPGRHPKPVTIADIWRSVADVELGGADHVRKLEYCVGASNVDFHCVINLDAELTHDAFDFECPSKG